MKRFITTTLLLFLVLAITTPTQAGKMTKEALKEKAPTAAVIQISTIEKHTLNTNQDGPGCTSTCHSDNYVSYNKTVINDTRDGVGLKHDSKVFTAAMTTNDKGTTITGEKIKAYAAAGWGSPGTTATAYHATATNTPETNKTMASPNNNILVTTPTTALMPSADTPDEQAV